MVFKPPGKIHVSAVLTESDFELAEIAIEKAAESLGG